MRPRLIGDMEGRRKGPPRALLGRGQFLRAERLAVRLRGPLLRGRSLRDYGPRHDQGRPRLLRHRAEERLVHLLAVVSIHDADVPAVGLEPASHVLAEGQCGRPLDRHPVVVVEVDQVAQIPVPRQRGGFRGDSLHEIPVAHDSVHLMIQEAGVALEPRLHHALRERHADTVRKSLAERAGRGFDARRVPVLGMTGRLRAPLAEALQLFHRKVELEEMEQRVEQHGRVSRGEHESIAVRPLRILGIEVHVLRPEHVRHVRGAHRRARVPRFRLLYGVGRQKFDRIDVKLGLIDRGGGHELLCFSHFRNRAAHSPVLL